ncbi:MAG: hypothetical protein FWF91_08295, partial [Coriobacteriia bacterium]|nr:hypothetical protein [Coriobacteriia bacterium]
VHRVQAIQVNDSRFDLTAILRILDSAGSNKSENEISTSDRMNSVDVISAGDSMNSSYVISAGDSMSLDQYIFWRVDKLAVAPERLPKQGDELYIRIPKDKVYLTSK